MVLSLAKTFLFPEWGWFDLLCVFFFTLLQKNSSAFYELLTHSFRPYTYTVGGAANVDAVSDCVGLDLPYSWHPPLHGVVQLAQARHANWRALHLGADGCVFRSFGRCAPPCTGQFCCLSCLFLCLSICLFGCLVVWLLGWLVVRVVGC